MQFAFLDFLRLQDFLDFFRLPRRFMLLARVIGNVVSTQKNQRYEGSRIMLCRQITPEGVDTKKTLLALDSVDSGEGDIVLIVQEGLSASTASTGKPGAAIDSAIIGVVDYVDLLPDEEKVESKR